MVSVPGIIRVQSISLNKKLPPRGLNLEIVYPARPPTITFPNHVIANKIIPFAEATMTMEAGSYLAGFGDVTITGYKDCAMFGPVIGTIPFIGYIFELEDGTDSAEFTKTLKDNANLRWNICTAAEQTTVATSGNFVFFLMSPAQFESAQ